MKIWHYKRELWSGMPRFRIQRNICDCSHRTCGNKPRTTGRTLYVSTHVFYISFDQPKNCDAPF